MSVLLNIRELVGFALPVGQAREAVEWYELPNDGRCADYSRPGGPAREVEVLRFPDQARVSPVG